MANEYTGTGETVPLTLSGDGQANPYHVRINTTAGYYRFVVVAASGTVEVYRWLSDTSFHSQLVHIPFWTDWEALFGGTFYAT